MDKVKRQRLESQGWRVGGVDEFLQLTPEEREYIELKMALAQKVRQRRQTMRLTQEGLARLLRSSQSRIAKIEAGDSTVSMDLLIRSLIALGATHKELARLINPSRR